MERIKEICGNNSTYCRLLKLYNNFEMPIGVRHRLIVENKKEQEKFIEFLLAELK